MGITSSFRVADPTNKETSSEFSILDLVDNKFNRIIAAMEEESFLQKATRKTKEQPLVPLGVSCNIPITS